MKQTLLATLALLAAAPVYAHHGVAGIGAAALEGPGAPIESASSATLPEGHTLAYAKLDHARFRSVNPGDTQQDYSQFWMLGIGHGFTPWLSAYIFAPYQRKVDTAEPAGATTPAFNTQGWADFSVMGQIGFKYEPGKNGGFMLVPANESLDDLEDWHFTLFAGNTIPHGNPNLRDRNGNIDPGKSTGFGKPSLSLGMSAAKMLSPDLTLNLEASTLRFRDYLYADGNRMRFGAENRLNAALAYKLLTAPDSKLRLDGVIEAQHLDLGHDRVNGVDDPNTGGRVLYLMPGFRLYKDSMSAAVGVKVPAWQRLNEATAPQQGSEGKEKYRLILSFSYLF